MYFLTEGKASIKVNGKIVSFKNQGEFFGEIALLSSSRRTADVEAEDYCFVEVFTRKSLNKLEKTFPGIKNRIGKGLFSYVNNHEESTSYVFKKVNLFKHVYQNKLEIRAIMDTFLNELFIEPF